MARRVLSRLRADQRGFTLIEQLVVAAGLIVILGAILGLLEVSQRLAPQDNERAHAVQEAQTGLERMVRELRHAESNVTVAAGTVTANVSSRGRNYAVTYDCTGFMPGSSTQKRCVRTEAGNSSVVIERVINPAARPVFTQTLRNGVPSFIATRIEVPAAGTRIVGQKHRVVLEDGAYLRNVDATP
jgi:Tfp pilus assembly protein PilV